MTPREVNLLLTKAAALDPRVGSLIRDGAYQVAQEWHALLAPVPFEAGLVAVREHYAQPAARALLPGDVLDRARPARLTADELARERWLAERGLSEADLVSMPRGELEFLVYGKKEVNRG